jgi:RNA polymerase sigma-70 factor (ECF subfamily)
MELITETTQAPVVPQIFGEDGQTLNELLSKYSPAMYRAALRKLGNAEDAEDALQDALLSASRNLGQFKGECHISIWLIAIAINSARMQLRRRFRQRAISLDQTTEDGEVFYVAEPADCRPNPEEIYKKSEMRSIVTELAAQLSPPLRNAFRLRVFEGLSIREAAQTLGIAEGTLKAQFFRARARINILMREALGLPRTGRIRGKISRRTKAIREQVRVATPHRSLGHSNAMRWEYSSANLQ